MATYATAHRLLAAYCVSQGWTESAPGLRWPYVTSPDGTVRLYFRAQSVCVSRSHGVRPGHSLSHARSLHLDARWQPAATVYADVIAELV